MASTLSTRRGWRIAATVASGVVLATSGVGYAAVNRYAGQVGLVDAGILGGSLAEGEPVTMLVVASDDRTGLSAKERSRLRLGQDDYGQHTDTMLLVHLSADGQDISAVSLPRDTLATIPAWTDADGTKHKSREAKLNAAYSLGGPKLMVDTVESMTGVTIDHYAEINFAGFLTMVDALDGVEVCLTKATKDAKSGLNLPAGRQTVDGKQALAYVRARYFDPTADIGRMQRQQKFVAAMAKKALSADTVTNPVKLDAFLSAVAQSIKTDSGMGTDQMLDLVERFKGINPGRIAFVTVPLGDSFRHPDLGSVLTWDDEEAATIFTAMEQDRPLVEPTPSASASVPVATVAPGNVRVKVLNGTDVAGLGATAADDLAEVGFAVVGSPANAPTKVGEKTVVRYDAEYSESVKTVAAALPGAELVAVKGFGRTFEITVGTGYTGAQKVKVVAASPSASSSSSPKPRTAADDICG
jgi:LCP family protein required for cell wall assembly